MFKIITLQTVILLGIFSFSCFAQKATNNEVTIAFKNKVSELYTKYKTDGFATYKGGDINMERNTEFPIFVELRAGQWYQFAVIGDPEATKIEMKLGLEGLGDVITDKFKTELTNEYWTQFSFVCPRSGRYLLTFYQRGHKKNLLGHVAILQRQKTNETGVYTLK